MSVNYEEKIYVESSEDITLLYEKVQIFAKERGWSGEVVTFVEAFASQEKNILDYNSGYFEANKYMNENHNPFLELHSDGSEIAWRATPDHDGWGLIDPNKYILRVKEQDENTSPIEQRNPTL